MMVIGATAWKNCKTFFLLLDASQADLFIFNSIINSCTYCFNLELKWPQSTAEHLLLSFWTLFCISLCKKSNCVCSIFTFPLKLLIALSLIQVCVLSAHFVGMEEFVRNFLLHNDHILFVFWFINNMFYHAECGIVCFEVTWPNTSALEHVSLLLLSINSGCKLNIELY